MNALKTVDIMKLCRMAILAMLSLGVFTGCLTTFEPDIESTPVLCMNSLITPGDSIKVSLTRTWRWSEGSVVEGDRNSINLFVEGEIRLYVNGKYEETLQRKMRTPGYGVDYFWPDYSNRNPVPEYVADYIPKSGDLIRLEANSEKYGDAWAEVEVPDAVEIEKVEYEVSDFREDSMWFEDLTYSFNLSAKVWFSDPASTVEYYMFETASSGYNKWGDEDEWTDYLRFTDVSEEPLFTEHVSALESAIMATSGYSFFSDRQISGTSYPIHVKLRDVSYTLSGPDVKPGDGDGCIWMKLYTISSSYYRHAISVWVSNDGIIGSLGDVGLADPVFESSNVSTGAGVVAAAAVSKVPVYVNPIIEEFSVSVGQ